MDFLRNLTKPGLPRPRPPLAARVLLGNVADEPQSPSAAGCTARFAHVTADPPPASHKTSRVENIAQVIRPRRLPPCWFLVLGK